MLMILQIQQLLAVLVVKDARAATVAKAVAVVVAAVVAVVINK